VLLLVPHSQQEWVLSNLFGALLIPAAKSNWQSTGETTAEEAAAIYSEIFDNMLIATPIIGQVFDYVSITPPDGCLLCDGTTYAREDYPDLYAVLAGTPLIVDADYFSVPDYSAGEFTKSTETTGDIGSLGGSDEITLTVGQLPSHSHSIGGAITTLVVEPGEVPALTPFLTSSTGDTGSGDPIVIDPPHVKLVKMIVATNPWSD
jgi:microcystin-dependent protein